MKDVNPGLKSRVSSAEFLRVKATYLSIIESKILQRFLDALRRKVSDWMMHSRGGLSRVVGIQARDRGPTNTSSWVRGVNNGSKKAAEFLFD
jgi:hypothetical protein